MDRCVAKCCGIHVPTAKLYTPRVSTLACVVCIALGLLSHGIRTGFPSVCGEHRGYQVYYVEKMAGRKNFSVR
jgi:hypothetical protein